ncbi:MAG: XTP/dITP diphosphatase [Acidobacteria bacterium]|nr:XTP/dITP diphosphatase [Acidobacteriota bacterium]
MSRLLIATRNRDKLEEIRSILGDSSQDFVSLIDFPDMGEIVESGATLEENAFIKARAAFQRTGIPSIGDDTGLEVDALDGRPGVYSSRYAGENATYSRNVDKLLSEMKGVPPAERTARFRCVAALVGPGFEQSVDGVCEGVILEARRGDGGFGYDPVFFVQETGRTFAEMSLADKNGISHRGRAFRAMAELLKKLAVQPRG